MVEIPINRSERTRDAILKEAHDLFIQQGYHGTSMRQIARNANVALGGLYNHFGSKEEVFTAAFFTFHPYHEILPALLQAQGDTVEAFVKDAASQLLRALADRPDFLNLMFIEIVEFKSAHVAQLIIQLMPDGLHIAQRLQQLGGDRLRSIPLPMLVRSFLGLFFSFHITELLIAPVAPPEFLDGAMDYFVDIYLHGILAGPATVKDTVAV